MATFLTSMRFHSHRYITNCIWYVSKHKEDIITHTTGIIVSHPFLVLRRQCQVRAHSHEYHLTPITLIPIMMVLIQRKGFTVLLKGMPSVFILHALQLGVEKIISKVTGWPTKLPPTWYINKEWLLHFLLKFFSHVLMAQIYSESVIKTVAITENFIEYNSSLSLWQIMSTTAVFGMLKYTFTQATGSLCAAGLYLNHCFDETERDVCQRVEGGIRFKDRQDILLKASVISYLSAEFVFYPVETVVHRLILQGTHTITADLDCGSAAVEVFSFHDGFFDCCDSISWLEGKLGFYKGFGALVLQAFLQYYSVKFVSFTWRSMKIFINRFYSSSTITIEKIDV